MMWNKLYKHYHRDMDVEEHFTPEQLEEQDNFTNLLVESPVIRNVHEHLKCKCKLSVRFTVIVVHWQKLRDCFLKDIVPVTHNGLPVITVISHLTQPTRHCCGRGYSPRRCGSGSYLWGMLGYVPPWAPKAHRSTCRRPRSVCP